MKRAQKSTKEHAFTVIYEPMKGGYQVTVPLLTGLVTFGRTFEEAQKMAREAIECHVEGIQKSGEIVRSEHTLLQERMSVAV